MEENFIECSKKIENCLFLKKGIFKISKTNNMYGKSIGLSISHNLVQYNSTIQHMSDYIYDKKETHHIELFNSQENQK